MKILSVCGFDTFRFMMSGDRRVAVKHADPGRSLAIIDDRCVKLTVHCG